MSRPSQRHRSSQASVGIYPLPKDTRSILETSQKEPQNYGLRVDRLLLCDSKNWGITKQSKERFALSTNGRKFLTFTDDIVPVRDYKARWEAMLQAYRNSEWEVRPLVLRAASRVIVGLGAESVLETSIRLHRIYGFPIIPGSALKGLARAYAELVECKNENDPLFAKVFGKSPPDAEAGQVIFFDAIPANSASLKLELDVMNPHYAPYYQGTQPPADYHNPVPVFFLTIGPGSEFLFAVVSQKAELATKAKEWLKKALEEMGVGAKTVAGYGLWKEKE
jgi:CRISPR type III-B/RAMP module RAMP protein Cmr6